MKILSSSLMIIAAAFTVFPIYSVLERRYARANQAEYLSGSVFSSSSIMSVATHLRSEISFLSNRSNGELQRCYAWTNYEVSEKLRLIIDQKKAEQLKPKKTNPGNEPLILWINTSHLKKIRRKTWGQLGDTSRKYMHLTMLR